MCVDSARQLCRKNPFKIPGRHPTAIRQKTACGPKRGLLVSRPLKRGCSSVGRALPCQGRCREFESCHPLQPRIYQGLLAIEGLKKTRVQTEMQHVHRFPHLSTHIHDCGNSLDGCPLCAESDHGSLAKGLRPASSQSGAHVGVVIAFYCRRSSAAVARNACASA